MIRTIRNLKSILSGVIIIEDDRSNLVAKLPAWTVLFLIAWSAFFFVGFAAGLLVPLDFLACLHRGGL